MPGPFSGLLHRLYGSRTVTCAGCIMCTCGIFLCYFSNDVYWITFFWGVFNGVGTSFIVLSLFMIIAEYFPENNTTMLGIAVTGGSIGGLIIPVLCEWLIQTYGLHGGFMILSGIAMNALPLCLMLKDTKQKAVNQNDSNTLKSNITCLKEMDASYTCSATDALLHASNENDFCNLEADEIAMITTELRELVLLMEDKDMHRLDETTMTDLQGKRLRVLEMVNALSIQIDGNVSECSETCHNGEYMDSLLVGVNIKSIARDEFRINLRRLKLFLGNDETTDSIPPDGTAKGIIEAPRVFLNILEQGVCSQRECTITETDRQNPMSVHLVEHIDHKSYHNEDVMVNINRREKPKFGALGKTLLSIISNKKFILISLCRIYYIFSISSTRVVLVDFSIDMGFAESDQKYIFAAISVGDFVGFLCLGWITDKGYVSQSKYMLFASLSGCVIKAILPLMTSKWSFVLMIVPCFITESTLDIKYPVLIQVYMTDDQRSIAMGLMNFASGILMFALPAFIGYFRDGLRSYDMMFYSLGAIGGIVNMLWLLEPKLSKSSTKRDDCE